MIIGRTQAIRLELSPGALIPAALILLITFARFGLQRGLAAGALFLLSLLAHEAAHIAAAQISGHRVTAVGLCWKGAYNRRERAQGWVELAISAAGPAINVALGLLLIRQSRLAFWFAQVNLVLAMFNLLPFGGSDGQRMLATAREQMRRHDTSAAATIERSRPDRLATGSVPRRKIAA